MEEGLPKRRYTAADAAEMDASLADFMLPRDAVLTVASSFYSHCQTRLRELRRFLPELVAKMPDFFDHKSQAVSCANYFWCQPISLKANSLFNQLLSSLQLVVCVLYRDWPMSPISFLKWLRTILQL